MRMRAFVPAEWCLRCQRCCRFTHHISPWIPVFSAKEVEDIINLGYPPVVFNKEIDEVSTVDVRVKVKSYQDFYICPFFDVEKNCCNIYPYRSFDCKLYPFLLLNNEGKIFLSIDKECPYVNWLYERQEDWRIEKFVDYLIDYLLSAEGRDEIGTHPSMISNYPGNLTLLRELKL